MTALLEIVLLETFLRHIQLEHFQGLWDCSDSGIQGTTHGNKKNRPCIVCLSETRGTLLPQQRTRMLLRRCGGINVFICHAFLPCISSKDLRRYLHILHDTSLNPLYTNIINIQHLQEFAKNRWKTAQTNTSYSYTQPEPLPSWVFFGFWCWILSALRLGGEVDGGWHEPGMSYRREDFDDSTQSDQICGTKSCQKKATTSGKKMEQKSESSESCMPWLNVAMYL